MVGGMAHGRVRMKEWCEERDEYLGRRVVGGPVREEGGGEMRRWGGRLCVAVDGTVED